MGKNLVIVESPAKSKTIEKYLGSDFKVLSSKGHIRDLATTGKFGLGVDIENGFKPNYISIKGKSKDISTLKKEAKAADKVYLATDPDREGEAISWHLKDELGLKDEDYDRIVFNEITKGAVTDSFNHARKIDDLMVRSQETRRILDRIIGFRLSKLMQSKTGGKSAGRVQSVALKLICDREEEINKFVTEEYWTIDAIFDNFEASLFKYKDEKIEIKNEEEANNIKNSLSKTYTIESKEEKSKKKQSKAPYITSTLQQDAIVKLNFSSKKTMSIAQKLYEGINIGTETVGLITYMRTDSIRLSNDFINETFKLIENEYGKEYVGSVKKAKKTENVQDAHEAIRPSSILRTPEKIKNYLSTDEYKLYNLIYYRALASLMKEANQKVTTLVLDNNNYKFKATGTVTTFDGYLKAYKDFEKSEDKELPLINEKTIETDNVNLKQHFTEPPARYTEAKLIKEMEDLGIGRPSTYAATMSTIVDRDYVKLKEKKFYPTEIGIETNKKLQEFFSDLINVKYTAKMEDDLDNIASGKVIWNELLDKFFRRFEPMVENAFDNMEKKEAEKTGEKCPECGHDLVIRKGRYGEFVACSNYPTCKYIKKEEKEKAPVIEVCECIKCGSKIVERKTKKGKIFYGCSNFPKCKEAYWDKPIGEKCPECNSMLVEKDGKIKCSSCDYEKEM
ncbi:MAG: type I DNA topoisomerase [Bacilli bacterium]|nr:type I DNA topoisomerase [Bacilli bacterium]